MYAGAGDVSGDVRACQLPSSTVTPSRARAIGTHGATNMRQGTRAIYVLEYKTYVQRVGDLGGGVVCFPYSAVLYV